MWRIYKEGQGKWGRGLLAFTIAIGAIFTVSSLHEALPDRERITIPVLSWSLDYRNLIEAPILVAALVFGVWLFNHQRTADFLIDTENELKHKVTWPSKREEINASIVVVVTVIILGIFILGTDRILVTIQELVFKPAGGPK